LGVKKRGGGQKPPTNQSLIKPPPRCKIDRWRPHMGKCPESSGVAGKPQKTPLFGPPKNGLFLDFFRILAFCPERPFESRHETRPPPKFYLSLNFAGPLPPVCWSPFLVGVPMLRKRTLGKSAALSEFSNKVITMRRIPLFIYSTILSFINFYFL